MNNQVIGHIITQLIDLHNGKLWMGDNFKKKISIKNENENFIKPFPYVHSIAEVIAHLTAWNEDLIKKVKKGVGELKDEDQQNWPPNEELKKIGWKKIWKAYKISYENAIELLKTKNDDFLYSIYFDQDFKSNLKYEFAVDGMLQHNIYHLGQIGLIRKLIKEKQTNQ